jgi:hypothetical protein
LREAGVVVSQVLPDKGGKYKAEGLGLGVSFSVQENNTAKKRRTMKGFFMGDEIDFLKKDLTIRHYQKCQV